MIDSEQVPWGKGEKQAGEAVEIEPETIYLQGTGARHNAFALGVTVCLLKNEPTTYDLSQV